MFFMIKGAIHKDRHHKPLDPLTTKKTKIHKANTGET